MHSEVRRKKPGVCPKCGMKLVPEKNSAKIDLIKKDNYIPLIVIIGLILLTSLAISYRDFQLDNFDILKTITYFMVGFFIVFAGFKLIDLKGFANGYFTYDILASRWFAYGYIYPFIELFFGIAMILIPQASWILWSEILVMGFSGIGVLNKILKREKFQCVCLGTFLKVPLTKITLIEDFGMALLALILLLF